MQTCIWPSCCHCHSLSLASHTHPFNGPFSGTTQVSRYQNGKTNLDFTEARDSEWQWHQLGHMQVCTLLQTDNHASNPPLSFLQAGCPSCRPTNSVKSLKGCLLLHLCLNPDWFCLLVPADPGSPGQRAVKRVCVCVCVCIVNAGRCVTGVPGRHPAVVGGTAERPDTS